MSYQFFILTLMLAGSFLGIAPHQAQAGENYVVLPLVFQRVTADKDEPQNYSYQIEEKAGIRPRIIEQKLEASLRKMRGNVVPQSYFLKSDTKQNAIRRIQQVTAMIGGRLDAVPRDRKKFKNYQILGVDGSKPALPPLPKDLKGVKLVLPLGIEFNDLSENSVSGILMVAIVDENSRLTAIKIRKYIPDEMDVYQAGSFFTDLLKKTVAPSESY